MEEWIGRQWHRFITHAAERRAPHAAVPLSDVQHSMGLMLRAGGGDAGMRIGKAVKSRIGGPRTLLERVAGAGTHAQLGIWQSDMLSLPEQIALFDDPALNRSLYLWLAALAAHLPPEGHWLPSHVMATQATLRTFPGLADAHASLLREQLAERPAPGALRGRMAQAERLVQQALQGRMPPANDITPADVAPVWMWLVRPPASAASMQPARQPPGTEPSGRDSTNALRDACRRAAQRVEYERSQAPMIMLFRAESILSWSEYVRVDRAEDDDEDGNALQAANDMQELSIAPDGRSAASRVKFDLDLPSACEDSDPLGPGLHYPEWDWRRKLLLPDHCCVQEMQPHDPPPFTVAPRLRTIARRMRKHLELARAEPDRVRGCTDGDELDLDAWVRLETEKHGAGASFQQSDTPPIFIQRRHTERSLACLLLADLSQSTDAYATQDARVIDLIRDALLVFGDALAGSGDAFSMLGFSSVRRQHVRMEKLKGFDEAWSCTIQSRIGGIRPGYYTRMGAAIRHATRRLGEREERQRLLLILTDGKPNDLDIYEGRYGLEDTRQAIIEARAAKLTPFCITMDESAHDYLPHLFGSQGYTLVHRPQELNQRLARVYASITSH